MLTIFLQTSLVINAQLKVHSNGNISIKNTDNTVLSPLAIGYSGDSLYSFATMGRRNGLKMFVTPENQNTDTYAGNYSSISNTQQTAYGIKASAYNLYEGNGTKPSSIGVCGLGQVRVNSNSYAYGVLGRVSGAKGAAICGQQYSPYNYTIDDKYAGLFIGKTKVDGNLEVTGTLQGTFLSNSIPEDQRDCVQIAAMDEESMAEKLASLNVIAYRHKPITFYGKSFEAQSADNRDSISSDLAIDEDGFDTGEEMEPNILMEQIINKNHYGISVSQLEQVFPNLVYEDKNGAKHINYIEMIPLLIQSINELQIKINSLLKGEVRKNPVITSKVNEIENNVQAVLFQNRPNPFIERTEIYFSLPDNTQNANICIFDMSGKMLKQIPVIPGMQSITINGYELSAGMYLYSLIIGGKEVNTKRMILLR